MYPQLCPLSLHDALPISCEEPPSHRLRGRLADDDAGAVVLGQALQTRRQVDRVADGCVLETLARAHRAHDGFAGIDADRSEEHTSELQSHHDLVCRLLLE